MVAKSVTPGQSPDVTAGKNNMEKAKRIYIRVSAFDKKMIEISAEKAGLPISQYMIDCSLHREIKPPHSEERIQAYSQFAKYSNNFTSIANLIKNSKAPEVLEAVHKVATELRTHLELIRNGK